MYDSKGFMKVTGMGNIVAKFINSKEDRYFGEVTVVSERTHKGEIYKTFTKLKVQGNLAKRLHFWNTLGDGIAFSGDLINSGSASMQNLDKNNALVGKAYTGSLMSVDIDTLQDCRLTKETVELRAKAHEEKRAAMASQAPAQAAPAYQPQQAPAQAAPAYQPQQAPAQSPNPTMDFDDDIPF